MAQTMQTTPPTHPLRRLTETSRMVLAERRVLGHEGLPGVMLRTPFEKEGDEAAVQRYHAAVLTNLSLPAFPVLSEERYYMHLASTNDYPLWTFFELVEIVDLARQYSFNFFLVSDSLSSRPFSPVSCLRAFRLYATLILNGIGGTGSASSLFSSVSKEGQDGLRRALHILQFYRDLWRPGRDEGEKELQRQFQIHLCLAAVSPMRIHGRHGLKKEHIDLLTGLTLKEYLDGKASGTCKVQLPTTSLDPSQRQDGGGRPHLTGERLLKSLFIQHEKVQAAIIDSCDLYTCFPGQAHLQGQGKGQGSPGIGSPPGPSGSTGPSARGDLGISFSSDLSPELLRTLLAAQGMDLDFPTLETLGFIPEEEQDLNMRKERNDGRMGRSSNLEGLLEDVAKAIRGVYEGRTTPLPGRNSLNEPNPLTCSPDIPLAFLTSANEEKEEPRAACTPMIAQACHYPLGGALLLHSPALRIPGHLRLGPDAMEAADDLRRGRLATLPCQAGVVVASNRFRRGERPRTDARDARAVGLARLQAELHEKPVDLVNFVRLEDLLAP
ncbi:hypothetical protein GMRT_11010 [Giardia muris]|uniref:Uncharacterized protein n=1 Tax=Giardia muris TaxID=5742 RepID=A0A4Z1T5I3_GIAMU|nr:hypothetical protein GMRT_11010 [Giardia muris]|eukprot:TNJ29303.1 hypothetical protein GMRT_11010 [Giardia muris]